MDHIATMFLGRLEAVTGLDLASEGLVPASLRRAEGAPATMPAADFFDLLEKLAGAHDDGRSVAVRLGAAMGCDDYGPFGLAFKSARDLMGSFVRVERYGRVVTSVANYSVQMGAGSAFMAIDPGPEERLGQLMTNELAIAAAVGLCREVSAEDFVPAGVFLSHAPPSNLTAYEEHFRCPLMFNAGRDGIEIGEAELRAGNKLGDDAMSKFFDLHLDRELADFAEDFRIDQRVCAEVSKALSEGVPTVDHVATSLGMTKRTLQRRLADDGHHYQTLVEATRKRLAERLLRDTDYAIAEVAFLTGYAEQSTFSRAFKRLSGQTPADFRRRGALN